MNDRLQEEIEDARVELEELNECGDLEDRLEAAFRLQDLEARIGSIAPKPGRGIPE